MNVLENQMFRGHCPLWGDTGTLAPYEQIHGNILCFLKMCQGKPREVQWFCESLWPALKYNSEACQQIKKTVLAEKEKQLPSMPTAERQMIQDSHSFLGYTVQYMVIDLRQSEDSPPPDRHFILPRKENAGLDYTRNPCVSLLNSCMAACKGTLKEACSCRFTRELHPMANAGEYIYCFPARAKPLKSKYLLWWWHQSFTQRKPREGRRCQDGGIFTPKKESYHQMVS